MVKMSDEPKRILKKIYFEWVSKILFPGGEFWWPVTEFC